MTPLVITSGEPAGIGPDICLQLAARPARHTAVVLGDQSMLSERAHALGLSIDFEPWDGRNASLGDGTMTVHSVPCAAPVSAGQLNPENGSYVLSLLDRAIAGVTTGEFSAIVTGPVQKSVIADSGYPFSGHTEYFQEAAGVDQVVMMLATPGLRVALVTTHLPLRDVPDAITPERLRRVLRVLATSLKSDFGLDEPRLLVCGLNPHAGENGHLGTEEQTVIEPVLAEFAGQGLRIEGPLPADTLFTDHVLARGDAVLAMYHDQGLPVLKFKGFSRAANITLGLPYVRTSVDHGTALDLAGTGKADTGSLETALEYAQFMVRNRQATGH